VFEDFQSVVDLQAAAEDEEGENIEQHADACFLDRCVRVIWSSRITGVRESRLLLMYKFANFGGYY